MRILVVHSFDISKVGFYSVQRINSDETVEEPEYENFKSRMKDGGKKESQLKEIEDIIINIGHNGATEHYFRKEGKQARAIPPLSVQLWGSDGITEFGLRLYCIKVTEEVVILLNGDMKLEKDPAKCPNCQLHFEFANDVAKAFFHGLYSNKSIFIEGMEIQVDSDELILKV